MPDVHPTTRSQKEVFLALTQLKNSRFYNLVDTTVITGDLDVERLRNAVQQMSDDLPALRTNVLYHEGDIVYEMRHDRLELGYMDFSNDPQAEQKTRELINSYLEYDFDIKHDLLARFIIIKQHENRWLFVEYGSHIILDGWTHALMYNRLVNSYNNKSNPSTYALDDLVASDQAYVNSPSYQQDREYWQKYCSQLPDPLKLSHEDAPVGQQLHLHQHLDATLVERLRTLAHARKQRMSSLLLVALGIFLSKISGQTAFRIGLPVAARIDKIARNAPGMMSTILPLGFEFTPQTTLDDAIHDLNHTLRHHLVHQRYHSEEMLRDIPPEARGHALFHTTLNVLAYEQDHSFENTKVSFRNESNGYTANLAFEIFDRSPDGAIEFGIAANGNLYNAQHLTRFYERFLLLLEHLLAAPDKPIQEYSLLSAQEWQTCAARALRPERHYETFNDYLARQVKTHPAMLAVKDGDDTLTYAELADYSQRLARQLQQEGVKQGDIIGVTLPRSVDWVICVIALYHLGATYMPLYSSLPDERLRYMLEDAQTQRVLTTDTLRLHALAPQIKAIPFSREALNRYPLAPAATLTPDTGAYMIYTSGSTGRPKGVLVPHEGIVDEFNAMQRACGIQPGDRLMQCSAMSFDVSCLEIRLALLSGAGLVITDQSVITGDSHALAQFITHNQVSHLFMTPAVLGCHSPSAIPSHVTMFLTGEATPKALLERFSHCKQLINLYGPSEATVITINPHFSTHDMSLGNVIDTMQVYVLDNQRQLMPPGCTGELYVAGTGLAKGYINKPDMTNERFVPDLFRPGQRMYATGDRVYQDDAGRLFYLGRKDNQVKLRGQRIELGEIRNALLSCPGVEEAHVLVEDRETLGQILVAYIRCSGTPLPQEELKRQLRQTLPLYMVPNIIHTLRTLPLTPNGKLDMRRLGQYIEEESQDENESENANANDAEAVICSIFSSVLNTPTPVRPDQDFFMLGGHSLLAFKVIHQIQEAFGIELSVADLMANPTPRGVLAQLYSDHHYDPLMPSLRLRQGNVNHPPVICIHGGSGIGWPYAGLLEYFPPEWPVYALQSEALRNPCYAPTTFEEVASDHLARVKNIQPHGPYHLIGWSFGGQIAHTVAAMLQQQGEIVDSLVLIDSYPTNSASLIYERLHDNDGDMRHIIRERLVHLILNGENIPAEQWDAAVNERFHVDAAQKGNLLDAILQELTSSMGLMNLYHPLSYQGDMMLIAAKDDELRVGEHHPEVWAPYVSGKITACKVDFLHEALMQKEALESYAKALTHYLASRMA